MGNDILRVWRTSALSCYLVCAEPVGSQPGLSAEHTASEIEL